MTDDQNKKPTAGFWITVALLAVLLLYPLSLGPACWLSSQFMAGSSVVTTTYRPILVVASLDVNPTVKKWIEWYSQMAARRGWRWKNYTWASEPNRSVLRFHRAHR